MHGFWKRSIVVAVAAAAIVGATGAAMAVTDFGAQTEARLNGKSMQNFGVKGTLRASSTVQVTAGQAGADPEKLATLAKGLSARVVTTNSGANTDMMALWPNDVNPTHLISCNEQGATDPGLQRIDLATGAVATIVTGTTACDPVRRTAWGTILFGEEAGNTGQVYELLDPLNTSGATLNRTTGAFTGGTNPQNLVRRTAIGRVSFEGLALLSSGVLYFGDELRPSGGTAGGSYFKFIPATPFVGSTPISDLSESPLVSGSVYTLKIGVRNGNTDFGHGNSTGQGSWVAVCNDTTGAPGACTNLDLGASAAAKKLTGYYRPEDLEVDPGALAKGQVKVCGNDTGIEEFANYGETVCITDGTVADSLANAATPTLQYLVIGNPQLAMPDNLAYQPGRGNWLIQEDGDQLQGNNDIFSCLPDGTDIDLLSDGCARVLTLNDLNAETTGGIFNADGSSYYVSIQHNVTGHGVVLEITGWR